MKEADWHTSFYYGSEELTDGFYCPYCNHVNKFDSDDADYCAATGKPNLCGEVLTCESCDNESKMPKDGW